MSANILDNLKPQNICIIKPSAFGDVVQALPLLPVLKERFPQAKLSWVINDSLSGLLEGHPHLDEIIPFNRKGTWGEWKSFLGGLRKRQFDLVFDLQGLLRTAVMTRFSGAKMRVGLQTAREGAHLACHYTILDSGKNVPAHTRYWRVAEAVGMGDQKRQTFIKVSPEDHTWVQQQAAQLKGPILAIHPGARWATKRWPVEKLAVVTSQAIRKFGFSAVILGSADEKPVAAQLVHILKSFTPSASVLNLTGETSLKQLAGMLSASTVLLSNDSGPMHLAAGLGTPVLGVFTATNALRSGPPGDQHELVSTNLRCAACYKKRCPKMGSRHLRCLDELTTESVFQSFYHLLEKNNFFSDVA